MPHKVYVGKTMLHYNADEAQTKSW